MRQSLRINQYIFQSTLSVRRATPIEMYDDRRHVISIHALREESDFGDAYVVAFLAISIHALREESDTRQRKS